MIGVRIVGRQPEPPYAEAGLSLDRGAERVKFTIPVSYTHLTLPTNSLV